ncbi:Threonine synthase [compost metagenome]
MDIQVASNFERYLYYLHGEDATTVSTLMEQFKQDGKIVISADKLEQVKLDFVAHGVQNDECLAVIGQSHDEYSYLLDPHTACGVAAAEKLTGKGEITVALSTAHPAKFNEAIELIQIEQTFPPQIQALFDKEQHQILVDGSNDAVKEQLLKFF